MLKARGSTDAPRGPVKAGHTMAGRRASLGCAPVRHRRLDGLGRPTGILGLGTLSVRRSHRSKDRS
eukprot:6377919-Alexandrium_andersonii.AAC.1